MNGNKRNMLLSFFISTFFIFLSLFPFSGNENVYVISKIGAAAGVINIVMMSVFLYFQSKKMRHLLN
ncbi:hypothetical protein [Bacillus thuringiensis]|uniref:Uncharacterized protein n=1 Tax=Bacillus thuringiensis subsp. higo TaxID=132266 RepID=A0A9X6QQH0_BACUH|nr:hypothetical protein [Bacillus thuringiensis]OUB50105.1 hypothetical protein BK716_15480 [Bacillus thuringiensis serovar higo]